MRQILIMILLGVSNMTQAQFSSVPMTKNKLGYFVIGFATHKGNLGGLSGANSTCVSELQTNDWKGKKDAGTLSAANVRAWLCDSLSTCQDLKPNQLYMFASAGLPADGGAYMVTDAFGMGPNDSANWSDASHFNAPTGFFWTGRSPGTTTLWPGWVSGLTTCSNWTISTGGANTAISGTPNSTIQTRWSNGTAVCNSSYFLICMVDPPAAPTP